MNGFSPLSATLGGALIGIAAALLWRLSGRIAGVSGVFGGLAPFNGADALWRLMFLLGLPVGAGLAYWLAPGVLPPLRFDTPLAVLLPAGLLVGIGTRLGGGCTSGHGVCGLARLSPRSLAAVATFMATGAAAVFLVRHIL